MKIVIICSDFQKSNIRKLPWKYVYEIALYLSKRHEVIIVTDSNRKDIDEIKIISVKRIFMPLKGETAELLNVLEHENPDKCIMLLGLTSFLRKEFKIKKPVIGIFTSPLYSINELIRNIGIKDSLRYRNYTVIHYINSLIPDYFVRKWSKKFEKIVFLSNYTQNKLILKGLNEKNAVLIPLGIDKTFLESPETEKVKKIIKEINPENTQVVMYFTSPLTLRGTDTLVKAFADVNKEIPSKLIFLSRKDTEELSKEEILLKEIAEKENISDSIKIISKNLSSEEIKEHLSAANIVCLPFKIVISDVPVSILEAMALKQPVISTKVACIPELLDNNLTVQANDNEELSEVLNELLSDKELIKKMGLNARKYMENYPTWSEIGNEFLKII